MMFDELFSVITGFYYCLEMLGACLLFFAHLKKRAYFWLRLCLCIIVLFLLSLTIYPFFQNVDQWFASVWYGTIYCLMIACCRFCCDISWEDSIYCASCGYLV